MIKNRRLSLFTLLFIGVAALYSCDKEKTDPPPTTPPTTDSTGIACADEPMPIIFVHGFLGSGDTYAKQVMRFSSNGYCQERLYVFDWNSIGSGDNVALLDEMIDEILAETGAEKVGLAGHSAGGGVGYDYLSDATRAAKVAMYAHVASGGQSGPAGPEGEIPTLNIWSMADQVTGGSDIPGATNMVQEDADHYQILTNAPTFDALFSFFTDSVEIEHMEPATEDTIMVSGKALTFGENQAITGGTVEVFALNAATGERLNATPDATYTVDEKGFWGPFEADAGTYYEFRTKSTDPDDPAVHYYREPFIRSNPLVYLRTMPPPGSLAGILLGSLPRDDGQSVLAVFSSNQAVIDTRDELIVDGLEISTAEFTSEDQTAIAFFLYDDDDDQNTSGDGIGLFGIAPFMNGVDMYFQTANPSSIELEFNGRTMFVRNWKSDTDGFVVPVFD